MAVDMFCSVGPDVKSPKIKGESIDETYKDSIDVLAWSWGMSQSGTTHIATGSGSGKVNVQDLSITKYVDLSSAELMLACCKGTHIEKVTLTVRKAGDKPLDYVVIEMLDVIVSSVSTGGSGGEDRLTENVTFNFAVGNYRYVQQKKDGGEKAKKEMGWSMPENKGGTSFLDAPK